MRVVAFAAVVLLGCAPALAQSPGQGAASVPPQFEVASIKQASFPNDMYFAGFVAAGGTCASARAETAGERVAFRRTTLCGLMRFAYDVRDYQIVDRPAWMTRSEPSIFYDVETRAVSGVTPTRDQAREMLRALLTDRFRLEVHTELRELPVYALVVARNGPRLDGGGESPCGDSPNATMRAGPGLFASCGPTTSMAQLAVTLGCEVDRAVVDRTGVTGTYAFRLQWHPEGAPPRAEAPPSIFTAIQEQLGLRLEPQRLPAEVLAIDRAERPSPN